MTSPLRRAALCALAATLCPSAPLLAAPPTPVVNARVETRAAGGALDRLVRDWAAAQASPAWLGYEVAAAGPHQMCCFESIDAAGARPHGSGCRIENHGAFSMRDSGERFAALDDETALVLLRADQGRLGRVRVLSRGCGIDASGRSLTWVEGVTAEESLRVLAPLVGSEAAAEGRKDKLSEGALMAIAVHQGPAADDVLERFVAAAQPVPVRKQAAFWMGNLRGRRGYETLRRLVREDPSEDVREHGVFALSQSEVPEAVDAMIEVARKDESADVRGKALFWLGQKAGQKAVAAIARSLEGDPETDVKKKAVFALSQLPKDEGVPLLIEVAKTNRNPEVRKQAMFWLGQTGDARALAFFEDVLKR